MIYVALAIVVAIVLRRVVGGGFLRVVRFTLAYAKFVGFLWRSKNQSWWMRLLTYPVKTLP